jgi:hypothetical protein
MGRGNKDKNKNKNKNKRTKNYNKKRKYPWTGAELKESGVRGGLGLSFRRKACHAWRYGLDSGHRRSQLVWYAGR